MKIWIRVYPAIELEGSPESITHNLSAAAILSMSVYRTEGQAREAAKKYGGLVIETIADLLKDDAIEKDGGGFYLSGSDEGNYIVGDPQLPTSVSCVVVAGSQRIVSEGRGREHSETSDEDGKWLQSLYDATKVNMHL